MNTEAERQNTWILKRYLPNELCRHIGGFLYGENKNIIMFKVPIPRFDYMVQLMIGHIRAEHEQILHIKLDLPATDFFTLWKERGCWIRSRPSRSRRKMRDRLRRYPNKWKNKMIYDMNNMIHETYGGNCRLNDWIEWCECEECNQQHPKVYFYGNRKSGTLGMRLMKDWSENAFRWCKNHCDWKYDPHKVGGIFWRPCFKDLKDRRPGTGYISDESDSEDEIVPELPFEDFEDE